jgi:hypothetical protein
MPVNAGGQKFMQSTRCFGRNRLIEQTSKTGACPR